MKSNYSCFKIGVTGSIGSGKTTVCRQIQELGYPVFYSDLEAKQLMNYNSRLISGVKQLFGELAYKNGELDRTYLSQIVFNNPSLLQELNQLVHPEVRRSFDEFVSANCYKKLVFNEAAILFETGAYKNFDFTILVHAPKEIRLKRVQLRDQITENQALERMKNQWPDEKKIALADFTIENYKREILPQLEIILSKISSYLTL
jgi:dephospho-CoA kinase